MNKARMNAEGGRMKGNPGRGSSRFSSFIRHPSSFAVAVCAAAALWLAGFARAQLADPTRPPAALYTAAAPGAAPGGAAGLQSVMITPTRRAAIINGEQVELGGKIGDARVIKITETEVVLKSATGTEVLKLFPDVDMRPVKPAARAPGKKAAPKRPGTAN